MDLRAPQESSLTMPIPINYGSIHESSKFRMLSGVHSHGGSGVNGLLHTSPAPTRASLPPPPPPAPPPPPSTEELSHTRLTSTSMAPATTGFISSAAASEQIVMPALGTTSPGLPPSLASKKPVKYRDCLKNHAANIGGHALDGCGEFMPSGEEGSLEALKCAACGCHRNFHRREGEGELVSSGCGFCYSPRSGVINDRRRFTPLTALPPHTPLTLPPSPHPAAVGAGAPPRNISQQAGGMPLHMALHVSPPDGSDDSHLQDLHMPPHHHSLMGAAIHYNQFGHSLSMKKRFRTKFSSEQKDKMHAFAEKLGWRIQKHDESVVHQFCADAGIKRHVFKVWMHNNKNTFAKRILSSEGGVTYLENGVSSPATSSGNMQV